MEDKYTASGFKVCFQYLETKDLEEYIKLAQEELLARQKKAFTDTANRLVTGINELLETFPSGSSIFLNVSDSSVYINPSKGPLKYVINAEDKYIEIFIP